MKKVLSILSKPLTIIILVLLADQGLKVWVKTNMMIQQSFPVFGNWFYIDFIENPGMAFGWEIPFLPPGVAKMVLTLFRIVAVGGIGYYLFKLPKSTHKGLKISVALIFAGAIGNIIDSAFYGILFDSSARGQLATFMPVDGGYESFLHGWVVDMFHFNAYWPHWIPGIGGKEVFPPIFNLADFSISVGIGFIFLFQKRFFKKRDNVTGAVIDEYNVNETSSDKI